MSVTRGRDGTLRVRCFACDFTADAIGLVQKARGIGFREALDVLARMAGRWDLVDASQRPARELARAAGAPPSPVTLPPADAELRSRIFGALLALCPLDPTLEATQYLQRRGLFADAQAAGLGALPDTRQGQRALIGQLVAACEGIQALVEVGLVHGGPRPRLRHPFHQLLIPWRGRDGRVNALQRRRLDGTEPRYVFPPRVAPLEPFGADLLCGVPLSQDASECLIVTEGALDCLSRRKLARLTGERVRVLAVPSATTVRPEWSALFDGRHVLVAFDPDKSGDDGARRFAATCLRGARVVDRERARFGDWNETLLRVLSSGGTVL
jgi:DNA primase